MPNKMRAFRRLVGTKNTLRREDAFVQEMRRECGIEPYGRRDLPKNCSLPEAWRPTHPPGNSENLYEGYKLD